MTGGVAVPGSSAVKQEGNISREVSQGQARKRNGTQDSNFPACNTEQRPKQQCLMSGSPPPHT